MMVLFPSLRVAEILFCVLDIALAFGLKSRGVPDNICLIVMLAALLVIMLGFRLAAVFKHQKLVNILYKKLDPDRFIQAYEPLLKKAAGKPKLESTVRNYLSTGYASRGDFEKAVELLEGTPIVEGNQAVRGQALKLTNLCSVYVLKGEAPKAEETLRLLESLLARDEKGEAGDDMRTGVGTLRTYIQAVRGWNPDEALLQNLTLRSAEAYHQVTNRYQLALAQLGAHKRPQARENLRRVAEQAPNLYVGREAARRLALLEKDGPAGEEEKAPQSERIVLRPFLKK